MKQSRILNERVWIASLRSQCVAAAREQVKAFHLTPDAYFP
jgi:hypothetical protein